MFFFFLSWLCPTLTALQLLSTVYQSTGNLIIMKLFGVGRRKRKKVMGCCVKVSPLRPSSGPSLTLLHSLLMSRGFWAVLCVFRWHQPVVSFKNEKEKNKSQFFFLATALTRTPASENNTLPQLDLWYLSPLSCQSPCGVVISALLQQRPLVEYLHIYTSRYKSSHHRGPRYDNPSASCSRSCSQLPFEACGGRRVPIAVQPGR